MQPVTLSFFFFLATQDIISSVLVQLQAHMGVLIGTCSWASVSASWLLSCVNDLVLPNYPKSRGNCCLINEHGSSKAHTVISSNSQQWKLALTMRACTWTTFQVLSSTIFLSSFLSLVLPVLSLHVVLGSNCTPVCTQYFLSSNTTVDEVTCHDSDYNTTSVGQRFKECISCELQSQTFDHGTNQTDLGWALCKYYVAGNAPP